MRKLFLATAGLFLAASAQADTPPAAVTTTPATPVMTSGDFMPTTPVRRGLFGRRLRNRMMFTRNTTSMPMTTTVAPTTGATPMPSTAVPMPMGKVSEATPMASGIVQTGGTSTTPMTTGTVTPAVYTEPMTTTSSRPMRMRMFRFMRYYR
ncbi:MAG TPA: hypothetical protein VGJ05_03995 [Fimbriiglobus sp.]|jgi:hypothetical protein